MCLHGWINHSAVFSRAVLYFPWRCSTALPCTVWSTVRSFDPPTQCTVSNFAGLLYRVFIMQQLDASMYKLIQEQPCTGALPMNILDAYYINGELYFHVLCVDNIVEFQHYRVFKTLAPHLHRMYFRKRHHTC